MKTCSFSICSNIENKPELYLKRYVVLYIHVVSPCISAQDFLFFTTKSRTKETTSQKKKNNKKKMLYVQNNL